MALPVRATATLPPLLSNSTVDWNVPFTVGAKVTLTTTWAPGAMTVPDAGRPEAAKGAPGLIAAETVSGWDPLLAKPTVLLDWVLGGMPPKLTSLVVDTRLGPAASPMPVSVTGSEPAEVVTVTLPPAGPGLVGVKVIGTVSVAPVARVAGRALLGLPAVKAPVMGSDVTVIGLLAVTVSVWVDDCPTTVAGKVGAGAVTGADTGAPNPMTFPSRVPTYIRLPATPGGLNLDAVPTGALHTFWSTPFTGTGL